MAESAVSLITVAIFCGFILLLVLNFQAFNLCEANNRWGIILFSFALPVIGTIFSLIYFEKKYHLFTKSTKSQKHKNGKKHKMKKLIRKSS